MKKIPIAHFQIVPARNVILVYLKPSGAISTGLPSRIVGRGKSLHGAIADWARRIEFERCGLVVEVEYDPR